MYQWRHIISLALVFLLCLSIPITTNAETQANWNEEYYNPSNLTEEESFPLTTREFVRRFNQKYSLNGNGMEFIEEGTRCNLYIAQEQMNIFLQFMDTSDPIFQFGSGLAREKWNKVRVYIATDDSRADVDYLLSFSGWFGLLSEILGKEFDPSLFQNNILSNNGTRDYPRYVHEEQGLQYVLEAYDDKAMFGGEITTTYSASIELITDATKSFIENGRFTLSAEEYAARLKDILGNGWTIITELDTTTTDTPTVVTDLESRYGASARIVYGGRDYMTADPAKPNSFELITVLIMADSSDPTGMLEIGSALVQAADPKADATRTLSLIANLVAEAEQQSDGWTEKTQNGLEYSYSNVAMPISHLFIISAAD